MGYTGKYLDVNLTTGQILESSIDMNIAEKFIGGKGLGAKLLFDKLEAKVDPLSPDNFIFFMTGPLSGTSIQTSGRWCIVTKSPHTSIFLDSQIGGKFGHKLKRAGFDYVQIFILANKIEAACNTNQVFPPDSIGCDSQCFTKTHSSLIHFSAQLGINISQILWEHGSRRVASQAGQ